MTLTRSHSTKIVVPLLLLCLVVPAQYSRAPAQEASQLEEASEDVLIRLLMSPRLRSDLGLRIKALDALAKKGTDKALDAIIKFSKTRDPELKAASMGSLALFKGNSKALAALIEGLSDRDPTIRAVTLRALRGTRDKAVVDELIKVVGREKEEESIRVSALKLLVNLTNQNMGLVEEDWNKWWELARPTFEFPTGEDAGFTDVKVRDLSYFGIEVASKRIGFLVDISSSMTQTVAVRSEAERAAEEAGASGATAVAEDSTKKDKDEGAGKARKIDVLKKELVRVLEKLPPDTFINIVTFHTTFQSWQKQLVPLAGQGRAKAIAYVQNLNTGTGTNVYDTLEFALQDRRVDTIYLLTDGMPTRGKITEPAKILEEIGIQNRVRGVTIHCIAFGEESKLLEDLAAQNGGAYRFVNRY